MTQPFSNPTNISSIVDVLTYTNGVAGNMLGLFILLIVTVVVYIALMDYPPKKALPPTMFVSFVSANFLAAINLVPPYVPLIPMVAFAASLAYLFYGD